MSDICPTTDKRAACIGTDPEIFFPRGGSAARKYHAQAKQICEPCPIRQGCLDWALENYEIYGTWGGVTEAERRAAHKKYGPPPKPCAWCAELVIIKRGGTHRKYCDENCVAAASRARAPKSATARR